MSSPRSTRVVQFGQESTWGTAVAASARLMGLTDAQFMPRHETLVRRHLGRPINSSYSILGSAAAGGSISADVSYEDILYFLQAMFGADTPSGTNPYTWEYAAPKTNAGVTPDLFTIEYGPSDGSYKVAGALIESFSIRGEAGGIWSIDSQWIGKQLTTVSLAALSDRSVNLVRMADTDIWVDAVGGTIGTTALANALIAFELAVSNGRHVKHFDALTAGDYGDGDWETTLSLTLEWNAAVKAYIDALVAATPALVQRQIRIKATDSTRSIQLDFAGTLTNDPGLFDERDGNNTVALEFTGQYNTTLTEELKVTVVNAVASLT